jgi:cytochrome c-type biogenesis protein CcmH
MTLWLVLALMTAAAVFAVLWPLARRSGGARAGSDVAVYRDQLDEIDRDRAAGLIGKREAEAAKVEVSRRLLAAADAEAAAPQPVAAAVATRRRRAVAVVALVLLPVGAVGLYGFLGSPSLPDQPLASRSGPQDQSIERLIAQVETHLERDPKDGRGWEVIAPIYLRLGRYDDAVKARRNALALNGETAERRADFGEALTAAQNGVITAEAKESFERAVALDAEQMKARFFLGIAAEQDGRPADAVTIWTAMLEKAPPDAPWAELVRRELARVQSGPSEQQIAAAADSSPEQRNAMIRGMVARLAERLASDGSDVEGWLRLMRSYMVLGEPDKARSAADEARRALAGAPDKLRQIDQLVKSLGLDG